MIRVCFIFFENNIFKHLPAILIINLIIIIKSNLSLASCFNYIPYAHNDFFAHLPASSSFCVKLVNGKVNYNTSENYSRKIYNKEEKMNEIYVFGDSQILGIDWDEKSNMKHDLENIYNTNKISLFASPNNGPFEVINLANTIADKENLNTKLEKVIISFNYGNDIFRLQKKWKLKNFVPLKSNELHKIMSSPILHDLVLFKGLLSGKFFSINLPDNKNTYELFKKIDSDITKKRANQWLEKVKNLKTKFNKEFNIIFYPPFWVFNIKKSKKDNVYKNYLNFICDVKNFRVFDRIILGKTRSDYPKLTEDNRHFEMGYLKYENFNLKCN